MPNWGVPRGAAGPVPGTQLTVHGRILAHVYRSPYTFSLQQS